MILGIGNDTRVSLSERCTNIVSIIPLLVLLLPLCKNGVPGVVVVARRACMRPRPSCGRGSGNARASIHPLPSLQANSTLEIEASLCCVATSGGREWANKSLFVARGATSSSASCNDPNKVNNRNLLLHHNFGQVKPTDALHSCLHGSIAYHLSSLAVSWQAVPSLVSQQPGNP